MTQTQTNNETNNETNAVQTAQNKIASIRAALTNGDQTIKASDLAEARNALEFAELQQQAAEIAKEKAAQAARRTNLLELQKQLAAVNDSRPVIDKKFAAFEKSLSDYLAAASSYQNALNGIRASLQNAGLYPGETIGIVGGIAPSDIVPGIKITDIRRVLTIGAASAENVLPDDAIKPLIESALGEYNRHF